MSLLAYKKRECKKFLQNFSNWTDLTWGFYVYGTYTRLQAQGDSGDDDEEGRAMELTRDDVHFQTVVCKVHAHAADNLRYNNSAPYNQRLIDTLRLEPACYMPGASLDVVCKHFRQHYAQRADPERMHEPGSPGIQDDIPADEKCGPKWQWCLVIDDEALESLENAPEPTGTTPPEGMRPSILADNASDAFVKLLSGSYTTMEKPAALSAKSCQGTGGIERNGWLKFSPVMLM